LKYRDLQASFVNQATSETHPKLRQWGDPERLHANLEQEIVSSLRRVTDLDLARAFSNAVPVSSATVEDYRARVLTLRDKNKLLAGMRFRNGDPKQGFVEIHARDYAVDSLATLIETRDVAQRAFQVFKPKKMRIKLPTTTDISEWLRDERVTADLIVVAGSIEQIKQSPMPQNSERVRLQRLHNLSFYDRYAELYTALYDEAPMLILCLKAWLAPKVARK
jgi:hypothetical protein